MKKLFTLVIFMLMVVTSIFAQINVTTVTFTGEQQDKTYQKLDSVLVTNLSQNWSETVYYPDTLILLSNVGITDYESRNGKVHLYQNIPNPFHGVTNFNLSLANKEKVDLVIYDISGRKVAEYHNTLPSGEHQFRAAMDIPQTYLLSALSKSGTTSIKMINLSNTGEQAHIELISSLPFAGDAVKYKSQHGFKVGDEMKYVGYATQKDGVKEAEITKAQTESETVTFTFSNEAYIPVRVYSDNASNIEYNTAMLTGTFMAKGVNVIETGFEYKETTHSDFKKIVCEETTSPFTAVLKNLKSSTSYTYKAYVKTADASVYYGSERTFVTATPTNPELPKVKTWDAETETYGRTKALLNGEVLSEGNCTMMEVGFYMGTTEDPINDGKQYIVEYYGSNFKYITELLQPATTYYYVAYATNEQGTAYGDVISFQTRAAGVNPSIKIYDIAPYSHSAQVTCRVSHASSVPDGSVEEEIIEKGICYSSNSNPTINDFKIAADNHDFTSYMVSASDLLPDKTYSAKGYLITFAGVQYSDEQKFVTREAKKTEVKTLDVTNITYAAATLSGEILNMGNDEYLEVGFVYSDKEKNPTLSDKNIQGEMAADFTFTAKIRGLSNLTTYYIRAYGKNRAGESYGEVLTFTTDSGFACGETLLDIQGNSYATLFIGTQCWMKEDLRSTVMPDGTAINKFEEGSNIPNNMGLSAARLYYYERTDEHIGHRVFYPWTTATAMDVNTDAYLTVQGVCPDGWHVPSWLEYKTMMLAIDPEFKAENTYGYNTDIPSNNKLGIKLAAQQSEGYWNFHAGPGYGPVNDEYTQVPNTPGFEYPDNTDPDFNSSGFSAIPNGYINKAEGKFYFNAALNIWTSISSYGGYAGSVMVAANQTGVSYGVIKQSCNDFYGVRCVLDDNLIMSEKKVCNAFLLLDGEWSGDEKITLIYTDENDVEQTEVLTGEEIGSKYKEYNLSGTFFTLMIECPSYDPNAMHFTFNVENVNDFGSEKIFSNFKGSSLVKFNYACGDHEPSVYNEW